MKSAFQQEQLFNNRLRCLKCGGQLNNFIIDDIEEMGFLIPPMYKYGRTIPTGPRIADLQHKDKDFINWRDIRRGKFRRRGTPFGKARTASHLMHSPCFIMSLCHRKSCLYSTMRSAGLVNTYYRFKYYRYR